MIPCTGPATFTPSPYEALLFDGTSIESIAGVAVLDWSQMPAPGIRRGGHDPIPGARGQLGNQLPLDAYNFALPITLAGGTNFARLTVLKTLCAALAGTNGLGTLEWRQDDGAGGHVSLTANGQFTAFNAIQLLRPTIARTELSFTNLSGAWHTAGGAWVLA